MNDDDEDISVSVQGLQRMSTQYKLEKSKKKNDDDDGENSVVVASASVSESNVMSGDNDEDISVSVQGLKRAHTENKLKKKKRKKKKKKRSSNDDDGRSNSGGDNSASASVSVENVISDDDSTGYAEGVVELPVVFEMMDEPEPLKMRPKRTLEERQKRRNTEEYMEDDDEDESDVSIPMELFMDEKEEDLLRMRNEYIDKRARLRALEEAEMVAAETVANVFWRPDQDKAKHEEEVKLRKNLKKFHRDDERLQREIDARVAAKIKADRQRSALYDEDFPTWVDLEYRHTMKMAVAPLSRGPTAYWMRLPKYHAYKLPSKRATLTYTEVATVDAQRLEGEHKLRMARLVKRRTARVRRRSSRDEREEDKTLTLNEADKIITNRHRRRGSKQVMERAKKIDMTPVVDDRELQVTLSKLKQTGVQLKRIASSMGDTLSKAKVKWRTRYQVVKRNLLNTVISPVADGVMTRWIRYVVAAVFPGEVPGQRPIERRKFRRGDDKRKPLPGMGYRFDEDFYPQQHVADPKPSYIEDIHDSDRDSDVSSMDDGENDDRENDMLQVVGANFDEQYNAQFVFDEALPPNTMLLPKDMELGMFEVSRKIDRIGMAPQLSALRGSFPLLKHGEVNLVVCLHDRSAFSYQFVELGKMLNEHGYTVLTFDFYGRGYSPFPPTSEAPRSDMSFLVAQTAELLKYLGILDLEAENVLPSGKFVKEVLTFQLLGIDMGAAVACAVADLYPRQVESLILLSPVGVPRSPKLYERVNQATTLFRMTKAIVASHEGHYHDTAKNFALIQRQHDEVAWQIHHTHGYRQALLTTETHFPFYDCSTIFKRCGTDSRPVLVIWGSEDEVVPLRKSQRLMSLFPHGQLVSIKDCGHNVLYEGFEEVTKHILAFFHKQLEPQNAKERQLLADYVRTRNLHGLRANIYNADKVEDDFQFQRIVQDKSTTIQNRRKTTRKQSKLQRTHSRHMSTERIEELVSGEHRRRRSNSLATSVDGGGRHSRRSSRVTSTLSRRHSRHASRLQSVDSTESVDVDDVEVDEGNVKVDLRAVHRVSVGNTLADLIGDIVHSDEEHNESDEESSTDQYSDSTDDSDAIIREMQKTRIR